MCEHARDVPVYMNGIINERLSIQHTPVCVLNSKNCLNRNALAISCALTIVAFRTISVSSSEHADIHRLIFFDFH